MTSSTCGIFQTTVSACGETLHIDEDFYDEASKCLVLTSLHERFAKRAKKVYSGRNRNVFDFGGYVVKLPRNSLGISDNDWEGSVSNGPNQDPLLYVQYPHKRMVYWNDIPVVFMEKIEHASYKLIRKKLRCLPDWVASVD